MAFFNSLSYVLKSDGWFGKAVVTTLSVFLVLSPPFGYMIRVAQRVSDGDEGNMPNHDIGKELLIGFQLFIAFLVYLVPVFLIAGALSGSSGRGSTRGLDVGGSILFLVLALPIGLFLWTGLLRFVSTENFVDLFNIPKNWELIQSKAGRLVYWYIQYMLAFWIGYGLSFLAGIFIITICLGFVFWAFMFIMGGYVLGRAAADLDMPWVEGKTHLSQDVFDDE